MPSDADGWHQFDGGATLRTAGSEGGTVVIDDEHPSGGRITLERDTAYRIPWAITGGVYGWLVHTDSLTTRRRRVRRSP